jgi:thioredoxin-like negative regulator of GroEL
MTRLLIAVAIAGGVSLLAVLFKSGSAAQVVSVKRNALPTRIPATEVGLEAGPAVIVFTESSCDSCQTAVRLVRGPAGAGIRVADIEYGAEPELHKKFAIDTVPTTLVVDSEGNVLAGWTGRVDLSQFTTALAELGQSDSD